MSQTGRANLVPPRSTPFRTKFGSTVRSTPGDYSVCTGDRTADRNPNLGRFGLFGFFSRLKRGWARANGRELAAMDQRWTIAARQASTTLKIRKFRIVPNPHSEPNEPLSIELSTTTVWLLLECGHGDTDATYLFFPSNCKIRCHDGAAARPAPKERLLTNRVEHPPRAIQSLAVRPPVRRSCRTGYVPLEDLLLYQMLHGQQNPQLLTQVCSRR